MSVFTKIPADTFQKLQLNAGVLLDNFDPSTSAIPAGAKILGATSGGINFTAAPTYTDFGEDVDNCPKNTKELMHLDSWDVNMTGTFISVDGDTVNMLNAVGDKTTSAGVVKVVPRNELKQTDFKTLWWVGDYSDVTTGENAGFIAIKLFNALSTGGFQIQTGDKAKGQFAFTFTGHFSLDAQDTVPFEVYVKSGSETTMPYVELDTHAITLVEDDTYTFEAITEPAGQTITWSTSDGTKASVSSGVVTAEAAGSAIITASITKDGVTYTDTCTVIVTAASS
jgi:hypothetical protein